MFKNAKVGDRVWDFIEQWGTIDDIKYEHYHELEVKFDNGTKGLYTLEGKEDDKDLNPRLFWNEIKFEIPEKPFDLENELKKLKVQEFKTSERNYFLTWDNAGKSIYYDIVGNNEQPDIKYFTEESINNFMKNIKNKKITKEQFFNAYKNVFNNLI